MLNKLESLENQEVSDAENAQPTKTGKWEYSQSGAKANSKKNKKKSAKKKMQGDGYSK